MFDLELTNEHQRWRARDVTFYRGHWEKLRKTIPDFELAPLRASDGPANPYLQMVVRKPVHPTEHPIPIATVSPKYALAPHKVVAQCCIDGLQACGIKFDEMAFEIGLSALSEWMNFRIQLPEKYSIKDRHDNKTALRLECFNSVDGSSRLIIVFGWIRFICSNGLIIGETMIEIRERHDGGLDLDTIPQRISEVFSVAKADRKRRLGMERRRVALNTIETWANGRLADAWGKKAAARVYHVCRTGHDVEFTDPFAKGQATQKPIKLLDGVPGSPATAETLYDVMQAMSFVAGSRPDATEQQNMLLSIDKLLGHLTRTTSAAPPTPSTPPPSAPPA